MDFASDSYIVLDVPDSEWTHRVAELRKKADPWRARLPVEITVAGSGGIGPIEHDESEERVFQILQSLASSTCEITTRFARVECFPNTQLWHARCEPETGIIALHERIKQSGIRFRASAFAFVPHCTIANLSASPQMAADIAEFPLPQKEVVLSSLSVYTLTANECIKRASWKLAPVGG